MQSNNILFSVIVFTVLSMQSISFASDSELPKLIYDKYVRVNGKIVSDESGRCLISFTNNRDDVDDSGNIVKYYFFLGNNNNAKTEWISSEAVDNFLSRRSGKEQKK